MPVHGDQWAVTKAVVRGKSHIDQDMPCQDACEFETSADGRWLVAAVSDGAGSAARSREGAQMVVGDVVRALVAETPNIDQTGPGDWLKDRIQEILILVRRKLRDTGSPLSDFHCTLVAALVGPSGGIFFHIGDGAAVASRVATSGKPPKTGISLWNDFTVSDPENGEYVNTTFFITQDDWDKHLRKTIIPRGADIIALMSDGAMPLVLHKRRPYVPFIEPIISKLLKTPDPALRELLLTGYLAATNTYAVTDDDKTLFVALNGRLASYVDQEIVTSSFADHLLQQSTPDAPRIADVSMKRVHSPTFYTLTFSLVAILLAMASLVLSGLVYLQTVRPLRNASTAGALSRDAASAAHSPAHGSAVTVTAPTDVARPTALPKSESEPPRKLGKTEADHASGANPN